MKSRWLPKDPMAGVWRKWHGLSQGQRRYDVCANECLETARMLGWGTIITDTVLAEKLKTGASITVQHRFFNELARLSQDDWQGIMDLLTLADTSEREMAYATKQAGKAESGEGGKREWGKKGGGGGGGKNVAPAVASTEAAKKQPPKQYAMPFIDAAAWENMSFAERDAYRKLRDADVLCAKCKQKGHQTKYCTMGKPSTRAIVLPTIEEEPKINSTADSSVSQRESDKSGVNFILEGKRVQKPTAAKKLGDLYARGVQQCRLMSSLPVMKPG